MTDEERALVIRILREAGLQIVTSTMLSDGSMTVRVRRPNLSA